MKSSILGLAAIAATVLLATSPANATTRDVANLQTAPLTIRQSVISELSDGLLRDPFDELQFRPFNLSSVNLERHGNLSPWPGEEGEQDRYVNALIGNNGNTDVRNGSDALQGAYIQQSMEKLAWGVSAAYVIDDVGNADSAGTSSFADAENLVGFDARFAFGLRVSDRVRIGGGVGAFDRSDEITDSSFQQGVGGFYSLQQLSQSGVDADFGFRLFQNDAVSWQGRLVVGVGDTKLDDFSDSMDGTGAVTSRFVVTEYDVSDRYVELSGGHNRRFRNQDGELQLQLGYRMSQHELNNTNLSYTDDGTVVTPSLTLLAEDPIGESELFFSAGTLFVRGWTQMFAGARLGLARVDGSTQVDSLGTIVDESIDDSRNSLSLILGLRQPLWNERFRLIASARAVWLDEGLQTNIGTTSSGTDLTQTTTRYTFGVETVLANVNFDLAWLFGEAPAPSSGSPATRQTIDVQRVVVSAMFGW